MEGYLCEKAFLASGPRSGLAALVGGARAQVSCRDHDLLHVHGEVAASLCLPSLALRPSVVTINGLHLLRRLGGWRRSVAEANLRLIIRAASATICVSESEAADVRGVVGESARLVLIRNGVASGRPSISERQKARAELGIETTEVAGLYLAALDPHKDPLVAARAALEARADGASIVLLFAGDGPLRADVEALARGSRGLRVLGFQPDPQGVLAAADFFVLPSRREGLSFSLLEAMSQGLPVIVSDAPGNRDAVRDAGIIVSAGDIGGFARAFRRLLSKDERADLGARARALVIDRFSAGQMVRATRTVYEQILRPEGLIPS
jgi:glycosyltransferase involved in cell wall biosynthesis